MTTAQQKRTIGEFEERNDSKSAGSPPAPTRAMVAAASAAAAREVLAEQIARSGVPTMGTVKPEAGAAAAVDKAALDRALARPWISASQIKSPPARFAGASSSELNRGTPRRPRDMPESGKTVTGGRLKSYPQSARPPPAPTPPLAAAAPAASASGAAAPKNFNDYHRGSIVIDGRRRRIETPIPGLQAWDGTILETEEVAPILWDASSIAAEAPAPNKNREASSSSAAIAELRIQTSPNLGHIYSFKGYANPEDMLSKIFAYQDEYLVLIEAIAGIGALRRPNRTKFTKMVREELAEFYNNKGPSELVIKDV